MRKRKPINRVTVNNQKIPWYSKDQIIAACEGVLEGCKIENASEKDTAAAFALLIIAFCQSAVSGEPVELYVPRPETE